MNANDADALAGLAMPTAAARASALAERGYAKLEIMHSGLSSKINIAYKLHGDSSRAEKLFLIQGKIETCFVVCEWQHLPPSPSAVVPL